MTEPTPTTSALVKALVSAQAEMENADLNRINTHFGNKYADLAEIRNTAHPVISKNNLGVIQGVGRDAGGRLVLRTTVLHESGEMLVVAEYPLPETADKPQNLGSAETYARRRSMAGAFNISAEEDDDAEVGEGRTNKTAAKAPSPMATAIAAGNAKQEDAATVAAKQWGAEALAKIKGCKTLQELEGWHTEDVGKRIARLESYDAQLHRELTQTLSAMAIRLSSKK